MPIEIINFQGEVYPKFQSEGFAAKFVFPFAKEVCHGVGLDVGCGPLDWSLPGAIAIDPKINSAYHAMNLPEKIGGYDYIFSSHCLEHLDRWVDVMDYWYSMLRSGGVLFVYLPDISQKYWLPWSNRKHVTVFTPEIIHEYMVSKYIKVMVSGVDLNNSFCAVGEK